MKALVIRPNPPLIFHFLAVAAFLGGACSVVAADIKKLMPQTGDHTSMWWVDGFPGTVAGARWHRCIQTGNYTMVLDTEKLSIPYLGPTSPGIEYGSMGEWPADKAAKLTLAIDVGGVRYTCVRGGEWTKNTGPRLVESGRFLQRGDVTDLVFKSEAGETLDVEARFETVAWAERLAFILAVRGIGEGASAMRVSLSSAQGKLTQKIELSGETSEWQEVALSFDPVSFEKAPATDVVKVEANVVGSSDALPIEFDAARSWHRINLDGIKPTLPAGANPDENDSLERIKLTLSNPSGKQSVARLLFAKSRGGIKQRIGSPITGVTAVLRDKEGQPTGIPVQLSKNWHTRPEGGVYSGIWFHGFSQVRLPAGEEVDLELTIAYGHWGGVAAASHAQLSLIGWGSNQHWSQSALGSWGESICFEPAQVQRQCTITDVRPLMLNGGAEGKKWRWTCNVGGGNIFSMTDPEGKHVPHSGMRTYYHRYGPCLTEVTFAGNLGDGISHSSTVSLGRSDDIVRGTYRIRLDVHAATDFSRLALFQIGADNYNFTRENQIAFGDETGLTKEWKTTPGGNVYHTKPTECQGASPWFSLHDGQSPKEDTKYKAWANRGVVIRKWKARLGGKDSKPWFAERGLTRHRTDTTTLDLVPPPGVTRLEAGDFVEATIEHLVLPQSAGDYYGPNEELRVALTAHGNTWEMAAREAVENSRKVEVTEGELDHLYPDIRVKSTGDRAAFNLVGGLGYVPVTITGLSAHDGFALEIDGEAVDQSVHGNDFWQTDFDPGTGTWSRTYNIPAGASGGRDIHLIRAD